MGCTLRLVWWCSLLILGQYCVYLKVELTVGCTLRLVWLCSLLILGPYCIYLRVDCGLYPEVGVVVQLIDHWTVLYLLEG